MANLRKIVWFFVPLFVWVHATNRCTPFTETLAQSDPISGIIPDASASIGTLNGLTYDAMLLITPGPLDAIKAHSPPNTAGIAPASTLTQNLLKDKLDVSTSGSIIAANYTSFQLKSLYFGCKLYTALPLVAIAQPCILSAVGFGRDGTSTTNEVKFSYPPDALLQADMIKKEFGTQLDQVYKVEITAVNALATPFLAVLNVEDVEFCGYS